jgi:hypothetical protein
MLRRRVHGVNVHSYQGGLRPQGNNNLTLRPTPTLMKRAKTSLKIQRNISNTDIASVFHDAGAGDHSRPEWVMLSRTSLERRTVLMIYRVTDLQPEDSAATPFYYTFKVQCTSCREIHPNWVSVSRFVSYLYYVYCVYFSN